MKAAIFLLALFAMTLSQAVVQKQFNCKKYEVYTDSTLTNMSKIRYKAVEHTGSRRLQAIQSTWTECGTTGYKAVNSSRRLQAMQEPTCQNARRLKTSKRRAQSIVPTYCPVNAEHKKVCRKC